VAVPAFLGRKGESEARLKLEWEDASVALTVKGAVAVMEIVNSMRSA
jgi:hypothetical protein